MARDNGVAVRHRADNNQAEIVKALRAAGCSVYIIGRPFDLLTYAPRIRETIIADCKKDPKEPWTEAQKEFIANWKGPWYRWHSVEEALQTVGVLRAEETA